jgi:hypothetical protein
VVAALLALVHGSGRPARAEALADAILTDLVQREDDAVVQGDVAALGRVFVPQGAEASLRAATNRLRYVQDWARARGARFLAARATVAVTALRGTPADPQRGFEAAAVVSEAFTYAWDGRPQAAATFGLGTRRLVRAARVDGQWRIVEQRFTDPLDQETRLPGPAEPTHVAYRPRPAPLPPPRPGYDAWGAVRYADTYCGAAPGCGNGGRYNPAYRDYNGQGGDCTNFTSQVLHEGGGMPEDGTWFYVHEPAPGDGSLTWLQGRSLLPYLLARGRARLMAQGTYGQLVAVAGGAEPARAPADELAPGDLVAYFEAGRVVHFGIVVGRDAGGYPLVDSHTADRYHVPWDIGWDQSTRFYFVRPGTAAAGAALPGLASAAAGSPFCGE